MTYTRARQWARLLKKFGLPVSQSSIIGFAEIHTDEEVWNRYIASSPVFLEVAHLNHFHDSTDFDSYLEELNYANMRSSFPSNARGRRILGPRILSIDKLIEQNRMKEDSLQTKESVLNAVIADEPIVSQKLVGKRIKHSSFGIGVISSIEKTKNTITVMFETAGKKTLSYSICIQNGVIEYL